MRKDTLVEAQMPHFSRLHHSRQALRLQLDHVVAYRPYGQ